MTIALLVIAVGAALVYRARLRRLAERVARACHEVRGPLSAAHLAVHGAGRRGELAPGLVAALELELRRASLALDDLRGRRADPDTDVDLADLLRCQAQTWREIARARGVELDLRLDPAAAGRAPVVRADAVRLAQATSNVVANAIEHGRGPVEIAARLDGDRVRVEVHDGGPGLPAPVAEIARRPRAGRGERGRGLAITSAIVRRYGGALAAATTARGHCVAIELPVSGTRR
jgi:signal transduction histidine kinase